MERLKREIVKKIIKTARDPDRRGLLRPTIIDDETWEKIRIMQETEITDIEEFKKLAGVYKKFSVELFPILIMELKSLYEAIHLVGLDIDKYENKQKRIAKVH